MNKYDNDEAESLMVIIDGDLDTRSAYLAKFRLLAKHFASRGKHSRLIGKIQQMEKNTRRGDLLRTYELIRAIELLVYKESYWRRFGIRRYWVWLFRRNKDTALRRLKKEWIKDCWKNKLARG